MMNTDWGFYNWWKDNTERDERIGLSHWIEYVKFLERNTLMLEVKQ